MLPIHFLRSVWPVFGRVSAAARWVFMELGLLMFMAGAMTSGAALSVVTKEAESDAPALGYTGAYAFANVILTLAGTLIMLIYYHVDIKDVAMATNA